MPDDETRSADLYIEHGAGLPQNTDDDGVLLALFNHHYVTFFRSDYHLFRDRVVRPTGVTSGGVVTLEQDMVLDADL